MTLVDKLFDQTIPGLNKALDLGWKRNEAIASNIANAETPGYRAVDVNFAGELERAFAGNSSKQMVATTHSKHMTGTDADTSRLVADYSAATKPDGNNVDLDIQMGRMVYNQGKYSIAARLVRKKLQMMRQAIRYAMR